MAPTVILIGFMGAGKSAVGRRLARSLGWDFTDADDEVEKSMGMSIPEAFSGEGEQFFRDAEQEVVLRLIDEAGESERGTVLSLGGGAVTIPAVRERLKAEPLVLLLDEDVETAFKRAGGGNRPLARDREGFRALYEERSYLYREAAGFVIETSGKGLAEVVREAEAVIRTETGIRGEENH